MFDSELISFLDLMTPADTNDCEEVEASTDVVTRQPLTHQSLLLLDSGLPTDDHEDEENFKAALELLDEIYDSDSGREHPVDPPSFVPKTTSVDASSTSASSPEQTAIELLQEAAKAKPKRQHRVTTNQQIDKLKESVEELTNKLQSLSSGSARAQAQGAGEFAVSYGSMWQRIAIRQLERRQEAEHDNERLRAMLEIQVQEAKNLKRILKRRTRIEMMENMLGIKTKKQKLPIADTSDGSINILPEMLRRTDEVYSGVDREFQVKAMDQVPCPGKTRSASRHVMNDVFLEIMEKQVVPFPAKKTEMEVWGALGQIGMQALQCVKDVNAQVDFYAQNSQETDDTMMISYAAAASGFQGSENQTTSSIRIRKVMRKYVEDDRTVFVSRMETLPEHARIKLCCWIRVVVEQADVLEGHGAEITLIKSHYSISRHAPPNENYQTHSNVDMAITVWDETISRVSGEIETLLMNVALNSDRTGE
ncbi:hypothetical protein PF005_g8563 [Phytophthora fragariae]|uniref:M96 mating-specific protein family n=2 Tax=Phytophthora fragariae TaxID=53985 RepID=A0A6A3YEX5_9STRA|nr:hypothetical protein PF003_g10928 [Phytophthora fragariae]KAE8940206.1 hypothetical protein PF009_g9973 [Phytophthora fragariae]KAE9118359.1 hypothetical protein PF010_g8240 [Phytophthora fragariae]KAE9144110.1 hypothetical protein PF006_g10907 [Phytophthora fragariae]KAE9217675.1 hypothetical protein PF005_g8563 [Phytophthora fragariae]